MTDQEFPKAYESQEYEDAIYAAWEKSGFFNPDNLPGERGESFSIVLPPPNVTGTLHMGHATMLAIEDIMTRRARMDGKKALWIPGTDHAAIATQAKVEKLLIKEGYDDPRHDLGREEFLARVRAFAVESHDTIVNQMKKIGSSVDWSREAYTLDEPRSRAVRTAFKLMHDDGLMYRGHRVVNWCLRCQSTLSDDELVYKEGKATLYTFAYHPDVPVKISTTRPETKVGDTAIAVNPEDERYAEVVGKEFTVPFAGTEVTLRVVADPHVEKDFGTGALGVTPAHSKADAEIADRHDLPMIQVIGEDGRMTDAAGGLVGGMFAQEAREAVVEWLRENGLMEAEEEAPQNLSVCYRCDTPVEPLPKLQWFIDVDKPFSMRASKIDGIEAGQRVTLKQLMRHVVETRQVNIIPERFEKTYFHWIDNLRDWNVSRQIWFGHRVPVWERGDETAVGEAPEGDGWVQDEDTLDTWFSSGLWTLSALGWPDETPDLEAFHPTSVLETGYDILFFWVARMILMTTYAAGQVPFRDVYLHGLVRDEKGRKMSKSLDNAIDPLEMIGNYGADATRLSLVIGTSPGNDLKLSEEKVAGFRNFANKLWNISRYVLTTVERVERVEKPETRARADRWILSRFADATRRVNAHMDAYEYSAAGELLRDFTWNEFADWYLEMSKVDRNDGVLLYILERLLKLWHPFMPFVTEEIWKRFDGSGLLLVEAWPRESGKADAQAEEEMALVREAVTAVRNLRSLYRIDPAQPLSIIASGDGAALLKEEEETLKRLARLDRVETQASADKPAGAASLVIAGATLFVPLAGVVDMDAERERLEGELADVRAYIRRQAEQLANEAFLANAPAAVVEGIKEKRAEAEETAAALEAQLAEISYA